jgi:hypothetical protein
MQGRFSRSRGSDAENTFYVQCVCFNIIPNDAAAPSFLHGGYSSRDVKLGSKNKQGRLCIRESPLKQSISSYTTDTHLQVHMQVQPGSMEAFQISFVAMKCRPWNIPIDAA